ncbi:hypothetical protein THAOC_04131 [Thalassiosira oceanica]|uniref:Protein kinase domain-containing protein n=1 Tax=Thalassiosira oceanica TaxID=159749 RepID=K0T9P2_THAOC|nr:hypothetical protein THAOC_04131 [Thalassiosira oceanica]|eukprot:EJK74205.1 hypothetical protein THAOC_04131 [Thalassiosira oceanica]
MSRLRPRDDGQRGGDGVSAWARSQMAESPSLLPDLRFHDLVFGRELGSGAFGTVRYARRIVRSLTRSSWPEYAVKVVSTARIEELGYEASVEREIAVLRTLSHPGVARLVSSFRFRDGAYLVLEYASGGTSTRSLGGTAASTRTRRGSSWGASRRRSTASTGWGTCTATASPR